MTDTAVIGFQVYDGSKPLSRKYTVRSAAEDFAVLAQKDYPAAQVKEIYGDATPQAPGTRRRTTRT